LINPPPPTPPLLPYTTLFRSSPTPATASTDATACTGPLVTSATCMCSTDPLNGSRLCLQLELVVVIGKVATDRREVEPAQDRSGWLALKQEVEAPGDQVLDVLPPAAAGPALEVSLAHLDRVVGPFPIQLDCHLANPAIRARARGYIHGYHQSSLGMNRMVG